MSLFPEDRPIPPDAVNALRLQMTGLSLRRSRLFGDCWLGLTLWQELELPARRAGGARRRFRLATQTGTMKGIGRVKAVFSKRKSDGSVLTLVTSDLGLCAEEVATGYGWRWEIEVTIQALKQHPGMGEYRHRWFEGAVHHLHLSCLAHLTLTGVELNRPGRKAQRANAVLQPPSTRELQNRLRATVWRDTLAQLRRSSCREEISRHLERSLRLDEGVFDEAAWNQKTGQVVLRNRAGSGRQQIRQSCRFLQGQIPHHPRQRSP